MKTAYFIILIQCFSLVCKAQEDKENIVDSLALVSRAKADVVLKNFDTIQAPKIRPLRRDRKNAPCKSRNKKQETAKATEAIPKVSIRGATYI